ncbi:transcription antitermination factor NusB [uncultured Desulfovibrio sp.]|uniref:transcription antitermination factor NusB n=1 Tax=uncultured Desulfovibrio sp. TaxID=167968 RepID=UPI0025EE9A0F|nr:transcription antitermination factor NusB [uncultured Desulfovibrio sp.]
MSSEAAGRASGGFGEKARLRRLGGSPQALAVRALCLLDSHHAAGCTIQAALQEVGEPAGAASPPRKGTDGKGASSGDMAWAARDRALATELAYGALRLERRLGWILGKCVPAPRKLPLPLRRILQVAAYALLFLERVPAHAVLHTAVDLAARLYGQRMGGLVNGILRSVQRLGDAPRSRAFYAGKEPADFFGGPEEESGPSVDEPAHLAVAARYYGLPPALAVSLSAEENGEPERVEALFRRSAQRPWHGWRINAASAQGGEVLAAALSLPPSNTVPADDTAGGAAHAPVCRVGEWGVAFAPGNQPERLLGRALRDWESEGVLSAQAAGSQAILEELGLRDWGRDGRPVWDACAGQGGKGLALAEQGARLLLCTDTSRRRLERIARECRRLGLACPGLALADARQPVIRPGSWSGGIIADVPCSGLGVLARRPDIRRRPLAEMRRLADVQRDIAEALAACLAVGGELAYLTCTLRHEENEEQLERLLRLPDMRLECCRVWKTPWNHPWLEGMFGARLRRVA